MGLTSGIFLSFYLLSEAGSHVTQAVLKLVCVCVLCNRVSLLALLSWNSLDCS